VIPSSNIFFIVYGVAIIALVMIVSMVIVQTIEDQHAMGTSKTVKFKAMKTA
jgi:hypothetical protein